jgi:hypothetical protein
MEDLVITQQEITRLKKRRDDLLSTACTRYEWREIFDEVKAINRRLQVLHRRIGEQPSPP